MSDEGRINYYEIKCLMQIYWNQLWMFEVVMNKIWILVAKLEIILN